MKVQNQINGRSLSPPSRQMRRGTRHPHRAEFPAIIADIKVTETVKEGSTIFRLEPGARSSNTMPDITPLLVAFGGQHRAAPEDSCAHDAMFRMTAAMAGAAAGR
jgi:hypothetical protein